jgi:hypothetical protein
MTGEAGSKHGDVEAFIERWTARAGGSERANYALFIVELCDLIGVGRPDPAGEETERNAYVFERAVRFRHDDGTTSPGRIDLYKKGCFVLEAKQSKKREGAQGALTFFVPFVCFVVTESKRNSVHSLSWLRESAKLAGLRSPPTPDTLS